MNLYLRRLPRAAAGLLLLSAASCGQPDNTWMITGKANTPAPGPSTYGYHYPDKPPVIDVAELRSFVERYQNRVVLVDVWAGWSRRCRDELGQIVRLQTDLKDDGFQVVSVNLDAPEDWSSRTVPALHGVGGNFPCVLLPREARAALRDWLAKDWSYELPARFLIDREGHVTERFLGDRSTIAQVGDEVRRSVTAAEPETALSHAGAAATGVRLRAKLVNTRTGEAISLPLVNSTTADAAELGRMLAGEAAKRLDRTRNERIAIAPFATGGGNDALGVDAARSTEAALKEQGFYDLIGPVRGRQLLDDAGLSAMAVLFDPTTAKDKVKSDYLLVGWISGAGTAGPTPPSDKLAGTADGE